VEGRAVEFADRLRILEALRRQGLLSEQEYTDKRQAILEGL